MQRERNTVPAMTARCAIAVGNRQNVTLLEAEGFGTRSVGGQLQVRRRAITTPMFDEQTNHLHGVRRVGAVRHYDTEDEHSPGGSSEPPDVAEVNVELKRRGRSVPSFHRQLVATLRNSPRHDRVPQ